MNKCILWLSIEIWGCYTHTIPLFEKKVKFKEYVME